MLYAVGWEGLMCAQLAQPLPCLCFVYAVLMFLSQLLSYTK